MKKAIWKSDWFTGLAIIILVLLIHSCSPVIEQLERSAYDIGVRGAPRIPVDNISIIAIDEQSINEFGRWPWPRDVHAAMVNKLATAGAKVVAYTPIFAEPQIDPGLSYISDLLAYIQEAGLSQPGEPETAASSEPVSVPEPRTEALLGENQTDTPPPVTNLLQLHEDLLQNVPQATLRLDLLNSLATLRVPIQKIEESLRETQEILNVDQQLANAFTNAGSIISPMWFLYGEPLGNPDKPLPGFVQKLAIQQIEDPLGAYALGPDYLPLEAFKAIPPIEILGNAAAAVGNINNVPDIDGGTRREPLVVDYYGTLYPSYALLIAAKSLNLDITDITVRLTEGVQLGRLNIGTDNRLRMLTFFYQSEEGPAFNIYSFYDVLYDRVPANTFNNKTVIVGATASGIGNPQLTPIDANMSEAEILAHTVASILNEDFFTIPQWSPWVGIGVFLLICLYIMLVLPRLSAVVGAVSSLLLLFAMLIGHYVSMTTQAIWIQLALPMSLLVIAYLLLTTKRFLVTERGKLYSDMESAESNKMLGLAFQGQGQLDMAFEKFRKCPKDDSISEVLYNLALDYERKRQFSKSGNVYRYIAEFNPQFRDVKQRIQRSEKMENTIVLGGGTSTTTAGTLIMDGNEVEKPMLGRYQVEKELGKGAMGVVYLGTDPKISRTVAIKTMALSQEFDEDELDDVKKRFFREAETAGRLNHPNIVTIYDAGEEHDLAYIAMEFLKGHDLGAYTKKDKLLPLATVLDIIQRAAEALDYAHHQNVVHRDIKPANIMYEPESGDMKITDFGIARITDSSKTKTGMVLGTPSYMSPEQLAGRKVDGRSDIFSLGVMLFQLTSGQLPFRAESMASLMYKIANDAHPSVLDINDKLPPALELIIAKALEKNADDRYQTADEMARDIAKCIAEL
ncbi:MAG: CHASE2 domain-containing protein [Gammaproteobacteria bacterium]|nr:CHASE2 domain-containing protein [Gammaproteobacteria bacterium]